MGSAGTVWYGMVWYGMVWYDMVWHGMVWYSMVWYGMARYITGSDGIERDGITWDSMGWYHMGQRSMAWHSVAWERCGGRGRFRQLERVLYVPNCLALSVTAKSVGMPKGVAILEFAFDCKPGVLLLLCITISMFRRGGVSPDVARVGVQPTPPAVVDLVVEEESLAVKPENNKT